MSLLSIVVILTCRTQERFSTRASTSVASLLASFSMWLITPGSRTELTLDLVATAEAGPGREVGLWRLVPGLGSSSGLGLSMAQKFITRNDQ